MSNKYLDIAMEKIVENEVNKVLEEIKAEIEQFAKNPNFGDLSTGASCGALKALDIINKHISGKETK